MLIAPGPLSRPSLPTAAEHNCNQQALDGGSKSTRRLKAVLITSYALAEERPKGTNAGQMVNMHSVKTRETYSAWH